MNKCLISLCFPTYNRCNQLKITIESILCQKEFIDGRVEIVVSDNASTDDTPQMMKEIISEYPQIKYSRNSENIGATRNYMRVLSLGSGILKKLCNDYLVFSNDSLSNMCNTVIKYQDTCPTIIWSNNNLNIAKIKYTDFPGMIRDLNYWLTWIGCFSIWSSECCKINDNDLDEIDEQLWHVRMLLKLASYKNKCIIINEQIVTPQKTNHKSFNYGLFKVFYLFFIGIINEYKEMGRISEADVDYVEKKLLYDFFTNSLIEWDNKKSEYYEEEDLWLLIETAYGKKPYWHRYIRYYKRHYLKYKIRQYCSVVKGVIIKK